MSRNVKTPEIDLSYKPLMSFADELGELADRYCADTDSFEKRSQAAMEVMEEAMWIDEQQRLDAANTTHENIGKFQDSCRIKVFRPLVQSLSSS